MPSEERKDDYVRETKKKDTVEKIKDHNSEDNSPHLLKHARENGRAYV